MSKQCNHTSVGMLVWKEGFLLLIERAKGTLGFAPPAGHVDDDETYEEAAGRELTEEVGLTPLSLLLSIEGRRENPCRRTDGTWHYWKIYTVDATGEIPRSEEETKQAGFYTPDQIAELAERTRRYIAGDISNTEWERAPGIEPVWYEWLTELGIIKR